MTNRQALENEAQSAVAQHQRVPPAVAQAAGRLPRRSAVRAAVATLETMDSDGAFDALTAALEPRARYRLAERRVAARSLPALCHTPERRAAAIWALRAATRQEHLLGSRLTSGRTGRAFTVVGIFVPTALLLSAVATFVLYASDLPYTWLGFIALPTFVGTLAVGSASILISLSKERAARLVVAAVEALAELRAVEALDAVVEQLDFPTTTPVQPAAAKAAATIAESVTAEHYGVIPKSALSAVCRRGRLLQDARVVRMLGEAGGTEVLAALERLANSRGDGFIRETARRYLPIVRSRASKERDAATLLRPAEAASDSMLLRPSTGTGGEEGLLVRPVEESEQPQD